MKGYHLSGGLNDTNNMAIFPIAKHATFKNLVLDDFVFNNDASVQCGFFASSTGGDAYGANKILKFENILIKDTCSITATKNIGSLMGLARGCLDFEAKNVINNAEIIGGQSNIAGFVGQASAASVPSAAVGSWRFENCINNGDVKHVGNGYVSGFVNQLEGHIVLTIKDCEQNGDLSVVSSNAAYFTYNKKAWLKELRFEGINKTTSKMYTKDGAPASTTDLVEPVAMTAQASAFTVDSVNNYGNPNNVMVYTPLKLSFVDNYLKVEGADSAQFDYSIITVEINGRITMNASTNKKTGEGSKILYVERRVGTADYSDIKQIMHLGYCTPSSSIEMSGWQNPYSFNKYYIPNDQMETVGFGTRYDTVNGLAVIDNTGRSPFYEAIQNVAYATYHIKLYKNDETFVGGGDFRLENILPFEL